jgi:hypothetical protein
VNANDFWNWMTRHNEDLLHAPGQTVADRVEAELHKVDPRIGIEVGGPAEETRQDRRELIFTAWSDADAFGVVRDLVAAAPADRLPGGQMIALKPPRGFAFGLDLEGLKVDAKAIKFLPLNAPQDARLLGVRLYVPNITDEKDERLSRALPLILETGLGEEAAAQLDHVEFGAADAPDEHAMPISQLLDYVKWHRKRHHLD